MPVKIERALKRSARKHGYKPGSKQYGKYVYGALNRMGYPTGRGRGRSSSKSKRKK